MAKYHITADKLEPHVKEANFNSFQLNLILDLMRSCSQLRQRKVIESLFLLVLPENVKVEKIKKDGIYGQYEELLVL